MPLFNFRSEGDFQLHKALIYIRAVGFVVVSVLLSVLWIFELIVFNPFPILQILSPVFLLLLGLWYAFAKYGLLSRNFLYFQFFAEYLLISIGIFYFAGLHSVFDLLYFLPIMSAMLVSLGLTIASILYAVLFYTIFSYFDFIYIHARIFTHNDILFILFFATVFLLFAFQGYVLMRKARELERGHQKAKDEILLRTVHDLRAPANAIRLIMEKYDSPEWLEKNPEAAEDVKLVKRANIQMMNLIKDVLIAARGGSVIMIKKEEVHVPTLIDEAIKELSPAILEKDIKVEIMKGEEEYAAIGDKERLQEVFLNIVDNAIKYNKFGGKIMIDIAKSRKGVEVSIRDTGRGIPREDLSGMFRPYFRGSAPGDVLGTGLGLYIVKQLVELMNGNVGINSEEGIGTEVRIVLPAAK